VIGGRSYYPPRSYGMKFGDPGPPLPYRPNGFYKNPLPQLPPEGVKRQYPRLQAPGPPIRRPQPPFRWKGIISRPPIHPNGQKPQIITRFQQNPRFVNTRGRGFRGRRVQSPQRTRGINYHSFPRYSGIRKNEKKKTTNEKTEVKFDETMIKEVKSAILKCVTTRQNLGMPPDCLRAAFVKAEGKEIPVDEIGYKSLFQLIQDIPEIKRQKNSEGHMVLVAEKYANKRTKIIQLIQEASKKLDKEGGKVLSPLSRRLRKIRHLNIAKTPKKSILVDKKTKKITTVATTVPKKNCQGHQ